VDIVGCKIFVDLSKNIIDYSVFIVCKFRHPGHWFQSSETDFDIGILDSRSFGITSRVSRVCMNA